MSKPYSYEGLKLAEELKTKDIFCLPGQILTFGGALTSRLEWFWRKQSHGADFTHLKEIANKVVERVSNFLISNISEHSKNQNKTIYESMLDYSGLKLFS